MRGRPPRSIELSRKDQAYLERLVRDGRTQQRIARRARILLAMGREPAVRAALAAFGVGGFAPTSRAAYEADLAALGSDLHLAELPVAEGLVQQCSSAS